MARDFGTRDLKSLGLAVGTFALFVLAMSCPVGWTQYMNPNSVINSMKPSFAAESEERLTREIQREQQGPSVQPSLFHRKRRPEHSPAQIPDAQASPLKPSGQAAGQSTGIHIQGFIPAEKTHPIAFIDKGGRLVLPARPYKSISSFSQGLASVLENGTPPHYGYINPQGQWVIEPRYEMAGDFKPVGRVLRENGHESRTKAAGKSGNGSEKQNTGKNIGNVTILAPVQLGGKWGYINPHGDTMIPFTFDAAGEFSEGLAAIRQNGLFGYVNAKGETVIEPQFDQAEPFSSGLARVSYGKTNAAGHPQYTFINSSGATVFDSRYDWAGSFQEGLAPVSDLPSTPDSASSTVKPKFGYVDMAGNLVVPLQFEAAWPFQEGLALVKQAGKYGFINPAGRWVIKADLDWADTFHNGLAAARVGDNYGFIDTHGHWAVRPEFSWVGHFSEGMAPVALTSDVSRQQVYGFVDKMGKLVIPTRYAWVKPFSSGLAEVEPVFHPEPTGP